MGKRLDETDVFAEIRNNVGGLISLNCKTGSKCIKLTIQADYLPVIGDTITIKKIKAYKG